MKVLTFKHGIHPPAQKSTEDKPIEIVQPQKNCLMIYPMVQHMGAPCEPIVAIGESVLLGQKIGEATEFLSAPIHSSVSGIVKEIMPHFSPNGNKYNSIIIENDGMLEEHETIQMNDNYHKLTSKQILKKIKEAGIVGLGGAGFPTHIKLNPPKDKKIDYIIVNASECEPYLTTDHRVLLEESERIKIGLQIILKLFPGAKGIIGIEENKMDAYEKMKDCCTDDASIRVIALEPKYPQGAEKQLIVACTKRVVPLGGLPADIGVIVHNVDTVIAVHRAIVRGRPLMRKVVTIAGGAVNNPGNFKVRLGMSYRELIEQTGGFKEEPFKLVSGGPMMGISMFDLDVPIIKTSSCILCFTEKEADLQQERNCIRCSKCVEHCPMNLMPLDLNYYAINDDKTLFAKNNGMACIECGVCSYSCPSKRHLSHSIRSMRRLLLAQKK